MRYLKEKKAYEKTLETVTETLSEKHASVTLGILYRTDFRNINAAGIHDK